VASPICVAWASIKSPTRGISHENKSNPQ
jgi:hypothetical protein